MLDQHETDPEPKILDMPVAASETDAAEGNAQSFQDDADGANDLNREKERVQANAARWESMGLMGGDGPEGDLVLCCGMGKVSLILGFGIWGCWISASIITSRWKS